MTLLIIIAIYIAGFYLSYSMLRIEHESEGMAYTRGDRLITLLISIGSFLAITLILILTWIKKIGLTGYWARPIKPVKKEDTSK